MISQQPILIAGPPRSGTTMLAGLIAKHGVWIGRAKTTRYVGTNPEFGSENIDIKYLMKQEAKKINYKNWTVPLPDDIKDYNIDLKKQIEEFVPDEQKWLVKTSWTLLFDKFWDCAYPDAFWLFPKRPFLNILDSINRHPSMRRHPTAMKSYFIKALHRRQIENSKLVQNSLFVDVNKIANKNKNEIQKLFNFLDIELNWNVVEEWINPKIMKI